MIKGDTGRSDYRSYVYTMVPSFISSSDFPKCLQSNSIKNLYMGPQIL